MSTFCSGGVYIYDDCSDDNTLDICKNHAIVRWIIEWKTHDTDREKAEFENRQAVLALWQKNAWPDDRFVYMDADERLEYDRSSLQDLSHDVLWIKMRLFDFYITEQDKDLSYIHRTYIWPEYRDILFIFRNTDTLKYRKNDQREVDLGQEWRVIQQWFVKHYGKSISIQQREDTCEYYATTFPKYAQKRNKRRGKAIHEKSDFWYPLILRDEKEDKWFPLFLAENKYTYKRLKKYILYYIYKLVWRNH